MSAGSYDARLAMADPHERAVTEALRALGWHVAQWDRIDRDTRIAMKPWRTPLRYAPDLVAVRRGVADGLDGVRLVDAKAGRTDTPNYDVANGALLAYLRWQALDVDVWLVFPDMRCARAADVWRSPARAAGEYHGVGAGTSFSLLPKSDPCVHTLAAAFENPAGGALTDAPSA